MNLGSFLEQAVVYIPEEWRYALAAGELLPKRAEGAALFADIAGFTPFTEKLSLAFGLRGGAEIMPVHMNRAYDALIVQVTRYGGSVISFAGDSITCWFDNRGTPGEGSQRACAAEILLDIIHTPFLNAKPNGARPFNPVDVYTGHLQFCRQA